MKYSVEICLRELLFIQECVIIPGFGGFLTKYKSADIDYLNYTITPPTKSISFNRQLRNDDGLLVNTFSMLNGVPFSEANLFVRRWANQFEATLKANTSYTLAQIGTFEWDALGSTISFVPDVTEDYLAESYGFPVIIAKPVFRNTHATDNTAVVVKPESIITDIIEEPILAEPFLKTTTAEEELEPVAVEPVNTKKLLLACFGVFCLAVMTMPFFGFHSDKMNLNEANVLSVFSSVFPSKSVEVAPLVLDNISSPQLSVINEVKIVQPVFIVQEEKQVAAALPAEVLKEDVTIATAATPVVEETVSNAKYVIIMGAFKDKKNAQKLTETIAAESSTLKAKLIPNGKVSYVAIPAGNSEASAAAKLKEAKNINPDCWIKKM
jgi:hypothetical protein